MILYGKPVADALREKYEERIEAMAWKRTLTVIRDETEDKRYLAAIQREAEKWKVHIVYAASAINATQKCACRVIDIRREPQPMISFIAVDGQDNWGQLQAYRGVLCESTACTAEAIIRMLDYYDIPIAGKHAVVIGRSERVGKPTAMLLLARAATVTVCHSKTDKGDLVDLVADADIVVCASGQKGLIDWTWVPHGCTVINVGGDCDECDKRFNLIPFNGGVGPVTTAVLMSHVLM
nr:MAG TPA: Tetrahydrofolate dehydrogenase/cyclohydrolase, NAD(P)-binding domain [Caudoviricetes sp.]